MSISSTLQHVTFTFLPDAAETTDRSDFVTLCETYSFSGECVKSSMQQSGSAFRSNGNLLHLMYPTDFSCIHHYIFDPENTESSRSFGYVTILDHQPAVFHPVGDIPGRQDLMLFWKGVHLGVWDDGVFVILPDSSPKYVRH